jgi:hypothetical protein
MARFQSGAHLRESTGQVTSAAFSENEIAAAEARVRDQEAHVLRLIVQGAPTQSAEDQLRQLTAAAEAMRKRLTGR